MKIEDRNKAKANANLLLDDVKALQDYSSFIFLIIPRTILN